MPLVRPWYYVWPESQSFKKDVQKCKRVQSILSDTWKNIMGGLWPPSAHREGIALQEISNLPQHKYRLDPRGKKFLIVRAVRCRECLQSRIWILYHCRFFKNRRNSFQSVLESWELRNIYIISSGFPPVGAGVAGCGNSILGAYPEFMLCIHLPSQIMLLCVLLTTSRCVFLCLLY